MGKLRDSATDNDFVDNVNENSVKASKKRVCNSPIQKLNIEDIAKWCKENNEVEWIKAKLNDGTSFWNIKKEFLEKFNPAEYQKKKVLSMKDKAMAILGE